MVKGVVVGRMVKYLDLTEIQRKSLDAALAVLANADRKSVV